jgi:molybdopterin-guanine dinucleotide biosynthesis protein A
MEASLLVLAGGSNRRAWLAVGNSFLLRCVAQSLAPAFSEVLASFVEPEQLEQPVPYRVVFDRKIPGGPLAGLEAGLTAARHEVVFALACDTPYITPEFAELAVAAARTADAAIPRPSGGPAGICGAYRRSALPTISAALEAGHVNTEWVVEQLDVTWLEGQDPDQFQTVTTPDELERLHVALSSQR